MEWRDISCTIRFFLGLIYFWFIYVYNKVVFGYKKKKKLLLISTCIEPFCWSTFLILVLSLLNLWKLFLYFSALFCINNSWVSFLFILIFIINSHETSWACLPFNHLALFFIQRLLHYHLRIEVPKTI